MAVTTARQASAPNKPPVFAGMTVHETELLDADDASIVPAGEQLLAAIRAQRQNPSSGCVLVH